MNKAEILEHWNGLPDDMALPSRTMQPVPYKHAGTTYAEDGIRLTGSQTFIDSVLVALKPLLRRENGKERLQVVYKQSTDRHTGELMPSYNCYLQVHERGRVRFSYSR